MDATSSQTTIKSMLGNLNHTPQVNGKCMLGDLHHTCVASKNAKTKTKIVLEREEDDIRMDQTECTLQKLHIHTNYKMVTQINKDKGCVECGKKPKCIWLSTTPHLISKSLPCSPITSPLTSPRNSIPNNEKLLNRRSTVAYESIRKLTFEEWLAKKKSEKRRSSLNYQAKPVEMITRGKTFDQWKNEKDKIMKVTDNKAMNSKQMIEESKKKELNEKKYELWLTKKHKQDIEREFLMLRNAQKKTRNISLPNLAGVHHRSSIMNNTSTEFHYTSTDGQK